MFAKGMVGEEQNFYQTPECFSGFGRVRHKAERGEWSPEKVTGQGRPQTYRWHQSLDTHQPPFPIYLSCTHGLARLPWDSRGGMVCTQKQ